MESKTSPQCSPPLSMLCTCRNTPHSQVYFNILNIYIYKKTSKQDLPFSFSDIGFKTSCILNSFSILKKSHQQTIFSLFKRNFKTTIENNAKHAFFRVFKCWLKLTQVLIKVITHQRKALKHCLMNKEETCMFLVLTGYCVMLGLHILCVGPKPARNRF